MALVTRPFKTVCCLEPLAKDSQYKGEKGWWKSTASKNFLKLEGKRAKRSSFDPSGVRVLPLAAGRNEGRHYFRYFGPSEVRATS